MPVRLTLASLANKYNDTKFWDIYLSLQNNKMSKIRRLISILYLYHVQATKCCDLMVHANQPGAFFSGKPYLPHGLNGIVISNKARIGKHVTILHQVTIGVRSFPGGEAPVIGNNVFIGAGAKILGGGTDW